MTKKTSLRRARVQATIGAAATAALLLAGCAATPASDGSGYDGEQEVSIDFAFWGNDDRADRYTRLIEAFNEEHPNITVKMSFSDFPSFWEKRQTEAAGGGLPDVFQFSDSYLRQYGETGRLLDLATVSDYVTTDTFDDALLGTGALDGVQYSLPTGYSLWANFINQDLLDAAGLEAPEPNSDFGALDSWMAEVTDATGGAVYGGTDYTQRIQSFELVLRAHGSNLFTDDGELAFTEDELRDFWNSGADLRDGAAVPQQRLEELSPMSGFGAQMTASEMSWSNFLGGYLADSGATGISVIAPPTAVAGSKDLYRQAGLQMAISENTDQPEAAAIFLDFVVNSEAAGEIFGTTLGFPASSSKLAGATLEGPDKQVADYIESAAARIGDAPPVPVVGYGSIEQTFWELGKSIGLGAISVDDAVKSFFSEADALLS
ncbi:extracellular solute-binding protein [Microbacterium sp. Sa4CUA7]|uniref:Extracellular solute-binding protein n=1 Tax=Microbacterium pullorum TaxID=2762236 RepID=A0ABR8S2H9_9MICO|nr:extracellular solute-binding protein [Microbacterium pullorum]MBD7957686.1 extracellular solute-binding protein [Microbacterium pullorum]